MSNNRGKITVDGDWKIEYYRNHAVGTSSTAYKKAVIVIHGNRRNADLYYEHALTAVQLQGEADSTLIIAPSFQKREDNPPSNCLYWTHQGWKIGENAVNGTNTSSFAVIDTILAKIKDNFPEVGLVTLCGHSAGGQFVQRYAGIGKGIASAPFKMRYVVANPSSYTYLSSDRPKATTGCDGYNNYKFGTADLPGVLPYMDITVETMKQRLLNRPVCVLLGTNDNRDSGGLDTGCEANTQGANRLERGRYYFDHIKGLDLQANHFLADVEGVGHDAGDMFKSVPGREALLWDVFAKGGGNGGAIPSSGTSGSAEFSVTVNESGTVKNARVVLDLNHTYDKDLEISLTSPDGKTVILTNRFGGDKDNFTRTVFDDSANQSISNGSAPFTGRFKPCGSLSDFNGIAAQGTWKLKVTDHAHRDVGKMNDWNLLLEFE